MRDKEWTMRKEEGSTKADFGASKERAPSAKSSSDQAFPMEQPPPSSESSLPPITNLAQETSVFEFGSARAAAGRGGGGADGITLAGFCPVSDELEPCRWEILPAGSSEAPQFRIVF
eukprot:TRINITY_DN4225_c0_g1_i2.p1 TRINITY_DN4225_c0_g1~~TRINITY_DN4225_c0_g1_i2.p1  ORF type:complete len:117 (-),score=18.64 TRINITY_DN4225_c0_g1_i2:280-630(-)